MHKDADIHDVKLRDRINLRPRYAAVVTACTAVKPSHDTEVVIEPRILSENETSCENRPVEFERVIVARSFVVVLTLTHRYNAVRGHRTGSNNSGTVITAGGKQIKQKIIHTITETNRTTSDKSKEVRSAHVRIKMLRSTYVPYAKRVAAEAETEETA